MKHKILFIGLFFMISGLSAQQELRLENSNSTKGLGEVSQIFEWGLQAGSGGNDQVTGIVTIDNDILVTGSFTDVLQCDNKNAKGNGAYDIFLMKASNKGKPRWIRTLGGEKADYGNCITANEEQICVAGLINGTVKFEKQTFEGEGTAIMVSSFNQEGKLNWLSRLPYSGIATTDVVELLPDGSVLAGGMFQGTITTEQGDLKSPNRRLAWQVIFSENGKPEEVKQSSGSGIHRLKASAVDTEGNIYSLYSVTGRMDIEKGVSLQVSRESKSALILQKKDKDSHFLWGQVFESTGYLEDAGISTDKNQNVVLCMNFNEKLRVADTLITCDSQLKTALISLDKEGKNNWIRTVSSRINSRALDVLIDPTGSVLVTGAFREDFTVCDLNFKSGESNSNMFLLRFNPQGKLLWYDTPAQETSNVCTAFALDNEGNIVLSGLFRNELNLNGEPMQTFGKKDIFLAKYFNCGQMEVQITGNEPLCKDGSEILSAIGGFETYLWNNTEWGGKDYEISEPGTYWVSAYTKQGCMTTDTVVVDSAEIPDLGLPEEITLYPGDKKLVSANEGFLSYVWNDGEWGQQREIKYEENISSELYILTGQTVNGCDVSDSLTVWYRNDPVNGLLSLGQRLKIYPNPVTDYLFWSLDQSVEGILEVRVTDGKSALMHFEELRNCHAGVKYPVNMTGFTSGNYLLSIKAGETVYNEKIIKK